MPEWYPRARFGRKPDYRCAVSLAGRLKLAEGREAEIFEWDAGTVLKLFRWGPASADREAAALAAVAAVGGPAPRLIDRVEIDGHAAIVIERIDGRDMLAILERAPARVFAEARRLAETHAALHRIAAPLDLPETRAVLRARIADAPLATELRAFALGELDALPDGDRLVHGDFHPANVLVAGDRVSVIDWSAASRGDPVIDATRTKLLLDLGEPLAPSAWMRAVIRVGRRAFSATYLRRYVRFSEVDASLLRRARPVMAAARLAEGIAEEVDALIAIVAAARAQSAT